MALAFYVDNPDALAKAFAAHDEYMAVLTYFVRGKNSKCRMLTPDGDDYYSAPFCFMPKHLPPPGGGAGVDNGNGSNGNGNGNGSNRGGGGGRVPRLHVAGAVAARESQERSQRARALPGGGLDARSWRARSAVHRHGGGFPAQDGIGGGGGARLHERRVLSGVRRDIAGPR